jgi:hypothetical protein
MNTHPNYTLSSRPQSTRLLRGWAVLSRGTFSSAIFLTDVALIVAMACCTGIAYSFAVYRDPGPIALFFQVGVVAASIFAISMYSAANIGCRISSPSNRTPAAPSSCGTSR